jgi:hypothetical protein
VAYSGVLPLQYRESCPIVFCGFLLAYASAIRNFCERQSHTCYLEVGNPSRVIRSQIESKVVVSKQR